VTIFSAGTAITYSSILNNAQAKLSALRDALQACDNFNTWLVQNAAADLQAAPLNAPSADASAIFSAFADAHALMLIYNTGLPPGSYPQPSSAYVYGTSQRALIGPLS
jgi:hypothetical protein